MPSIHRFVDEPRRKFVEEAKAAAVEPLPEEHRRFLELCSQAHTLIDSAYTSADIWLTRISQAYRQAWENYTAILTEAEAQQNLQVSLILDYAVALLPIRIPAIAKLITDALKRKSVGEYLADGIGRLIETTTEKGLNAMNALLVAQLPSSLLIVQPEDWEANIKVEILKEKKFVLELLLRWQTSVNNRDPNFKVDFDPFERIKDALRIAGQPLDDLPEIDIQQQANAFESGFWAAWLSENGYVVVPFESAGGSIGGAFRWSYVVPQIAQLRLNVPAPIAQRVKELRLDPSPYLRKAKARASEEARSRGYRILEEGRLLPP
jgi:hypothetical protein